MKSCQRGREWDLFVTLHDYMTHTLSEAARILGISRRTVHRYILKCSMIRLTDGRVSLEDLKCFRNIVAQRAKGRGRKWGSKPQGTELLEPGIGKAPAERGYYRGRTTEQRVEIILRELGAIPRGDPAWVALAPYLSGKAEAELRVLLKAAAGAKAPAK